MIENIRTPKTQGWSRIKIEPTEEFPYLAFFHPKTHIQAISAFEPYVEGGERMLHLTIGKMDARSGETSRCTMADAMWAANEFGMRDAQITPVPGGMMMFDAWMAPQP